MRIAYVCTDPGIPIFGSKGASIHAQAVIRVLRNLGHEVHLVTVRPGDQDDADLPIHVLSPVPSGGPAFREEAARRSDAEVAPVLDDIRPDLVYERYSLWGRTATQWAAARGVPSLLEVNAPLVDEQARYRELHDRHAAERVAQSALSSATSVLCVSEGVAAWARQRSARPASIHVLPNGVDTDRIRPPERAVTPAEADRFTVGFVGTLKAWHGIDILVSAMGDLVRQERAADQRPTWRLLVVGDGPMADQIRTQADRLDLTDLVEFTGALPNEQVGRHLHRMDIACAPYPEVQDFYFSPLKIYEYLAAGLPIVASGIGQIPDLLGQGRHGALVPPGDAAALAAQLADLRENEPRRAQWRIESRRVAESRHTWRSVVTQALHLGLHHSEELAG